MTNWKELIREASDGDEIIACTLTEEELLQPFNAGYGIPNGKPFTAWSDTYVYFPTEYDGTEWVSRVPRNPREIGDSMSLEDIKEDMISRMHTDECGWQDGKEWRLDDDQFYAIFNIMSTLSHDIIEAHT